MRSFKGRLGEALSGLGVSIMRFPLPLACALAAVVCLAVNRPGATLNDAIEDTLFRLTMLAVIGFFVTLGVTLIAERRKWPVWRGFLVSAIGLALVAAKIFWGEPELGMHSASIIFLGPAAVLFAVTAPFLPWFGGRIGGGSDDAFWEFNKTAWLACLLGYAAAVALFIGGASALSVTEYLFKVNIGDRFYWYLSVFGFSLVCPWLALSGIPRSFDAPETTEMPRWLAILTAYILVPLAIVYLLILWVYIGWIVVQWDLPRGRVAYIVAGCAVYGIIVHMAVYPLRLTGAWMVRLYYRFFYISLAGPVLLMGIGLVRRIDAYGVTEGRYAVAVLALWLAAMVVLHVAPVGRRLVWVPLAVAVPLLLASFGPWGAFSISETAQMGRLERLLAENGILKNGTITPAEKQITGNPARNITSIVRYLRDTGKLEAIHPWMEAAKVEVDGKRPTARAIVEAFGVEFRRRHFVSNTFYVHNPDMSGMNIWSNDRKFFDIEGYRVLGFIDGSARNKGQWWSYKGPRPGELYRFDLDAKTGRLRIDGPDGKKDLVIDLKPIAAKVRNLKGKRRGRHMVVEAEGRTMRVRLMIINLSGKIVGSEVQVTGLDALILIGDKKG